MSISALRADVSERARAFSWAQWSQMGVLARAERRDRWAIDPEALLLFSLEVGRDDPRLFDEVLDWVVVNERLVSVRRLRNLARDDADRALVGAVLTWLARRGPRARLGAKGAPDETGADEAQPLFRSTSTPIREPDEAFLAHGLLRARIEPRGNSQPPDPSLPVNFAFRLRHLLGVGARAEVTRVLLGIDAPRVSVQVVAESAGYAKRNVHEALASLVAARVVDVVTLGNEQRFTAPRERWAALLEMPGSELPSHRNWPAMLLALRRLSRWLADPGTEELSDYMRASAARQLIEEIGPWLQSAGVPIADSAASGAGYWDDFESTVQGALGAIS